MSNIRFWTITKLNVHWNNYRWLNKCDSSKKILQTTPCFSYLWGFFWKLTVYFYPKSIEEDDTGVSNIRFWTITKINLHWNNYKWLNKCDSPKKILKRLPAFHIFVFFWKLTVYFYPKSIEEDDTVLSTRTTHKMDEVAPIDCNWGLQ